MKLWSLAAVAVVLAAGPVARGMFAQPEQVPVNRLVDNIAAYVKEHPEDANARYLLGRVNYLAVASKSGSIAVWRRRGRDGELPRVADDPFQTFDGPPRMAGRPRGRVQAAPPTPVVPTNEELAKHVQAAIENFQKAIEMDAKEGLYHLSLASLLEMTPGEVARALGGWPPGVVKIELTAEGAARVEKLIEALADSDVKVRENATRELQAIGPGVVGPLMKERPDATPEVQDRVTQVLKRTWEEAAIPHFQRAFELAQEKDKAIENKPLLGLNSIVSYEASKRYLVLTGMRERSDAEREAAGKMEAHVKALDEKPPGPITPIVFSLERATPLAQMVNGAARVRFDLDGTGREWGWSWVGPETGVLVWDSKGEGKIDSGRQLFGNMTFGLIWRDGYQAMSSLDDNRDGLLTGAELSGLAVWRDRNGNGVSEPGEVVPVERAGVRSLSCRATGVEGDSPANLRGVTLSDGRVLPTYDWVAKAWRGPG